jgi:predicted short-subunit dehydrogenase-like oxidoreductase (DUF2520 family)
MALQELRPSRSVRDNKIEELSDACRAAIVTGIDLDDKHYSLKEDDQINIGNLAMLAAQGQTVLYHADDELCSAYTPEHFSVVAQAATTHKIYHTAYFNHLKAWVQRTEKPAELAAITYGADLPPDLAANMAALLGGATTDE